MSNEITSGLLATALNETVINQAFEIARSNRIGLLGIVSMAEARRATDGYKMSWLDMRVDAQGSALTAGITSSVTTIPVTSGLKFRVGMTIAAVGSEEVMLVTAISSNNLTVVRAFGGTTGEAVLTAVEMVVDSVGREENSQAQNDGIYQPEVMENYFQTMDTAVEMSRRALASLQYGNTNDLNFQLGERIKQLSIQLNRALIRGRKASPTVGSDVRTYTGGLRYWLDQAGAIKTDASAAALTLDAINTVNAEIVSRGGSADTVAVGLVQARKLSALVAANYSSNRLADWTADEGSVLTLPSDLPLVGSVNKIVVDTNLADDELLVLQSDSINIVPMAAGNSKDSGNWMTKDATVNGQDGERVRIIGDFAVEARQTKTHMGRIHNLGV